MYVVFVFVHKYMRIFSGDMCNVLCSHVIKTSQCIRPCSDDKYNPFSVLYLSFLIEIFLYFAIICE